MQRVGLLRKSPNPHLLRVLQIRLFHEVLLPERFWGSLPLRRRFNALSLAETSANSE